MTSEKARGGVDWPLVGRAEELDLLRRLRSGSRAVSAVISGPPGVGKSRLARAALAQAEREGWATMALRASAGLADIPLGPFRTVLRIPNSPDLAELSGSVTRELVALRSPKGLLVLFEDAQDLDEASAGVLHQLVAADVAVAIITSRSDSAPPAAVTDLWKDALAERIELQNLSERETTELLVGGLDGDVQDSSANRLWRVTGGNPLYLREVVVSSMETGALEQVEGEWRWRGGWASSPRLQEIVSARLGRLDPDELTVMEMLALAGPLPLGLVTRIAAARAVEELEGRGLVTVETSGRRLEVGITHPLHAEVLRGKLPALRQRSIRRNLVDALSASGMRRTSDHVRLACWSLESGLEVNPLTLTLGSDASLFGIGPAIAGRLHEILPDVAAEPMAAGSPVRQNFEIAVRLARAAFERSGAVVDGVALASTLAWTGAIGASEAVLAELAEEAELIDDRFRLALALAWVRFWGRYAVGEATAALNEVIEAADGSEDPELLAEAYQELAGFALNTARPASALDLAQRAAAAQGVELSCSRAAAVAAAALAYLGRCRDAIALADEALPLAHAEGHPLTVATLLFTRAGALARLGQLSEGRTLVEWLRDVALSGGLPDAAGTVGVLLGEILLRQGLPAGAGRVFRDSCGLLGERDVLGYRPWALSGLALARAQTGQEEGAGEALAEARRTQPVVRHFDMSHYMAEVEIEARAGRPGSAVRAAQEAVAWARGLGLVIEEAQALDAWGRIAPSDATAARLAELAGMTDSEIVGLQADNARALVKGDPESLLLVSERCAALTAWWMAAEAAAAAAVILDRRRQTRAAKAAWRTATTLREQCEGGPWSGPDEVAGRTRLTKREREVAALAAAGRSSKEIAARMFLSFRTVENHLQNAYMKLGVTDRAGLAEVLGSSGPGE